MRKTLPRPWKIFWIAFFVIVSLNLLGFYLSIFVPVPNMIANQISLIISFPAFLLMSPWIDTPYDNSPFFAITIFTLAFVVCPTLWAGMIVGAVRGGEKILEMMKKK